MVHSARLRPSPVEGSEKPGKGLVFIKPCPETSVELWVSPPTSQLAVISPSTETPTHPFTKDSQSPALADLHARFQPRVYQPRINFHFMLWSCFPSCPCAGPASSELLEQKLGRIWSVGMGVIGEPVEVREQQCLVELTFSA